MKTPSYLSLLASVLLLSACATAYPPLNQNMTCDDILVELRNLEAEIANAPQSAEINRTVDTGTTVAAQGASIAGVPYVGSVLSIGKTLFNHNKQSTAARAQQRQERLYDLEGMAYEKNCI